MRFLQLFMIILVFSVGNLLFAVPNHIMNGGLTGLSLMSFYLFHFNIGLSLFLLNVPLLILAYFKYRDLFYKSVLSMFSLSVIVGILQDYIIPLGIQNIWVGSILGGLWMGLCLGLISKMNGSLGGGSLLGRMLHLRYGYSLSKTIFIIDASVYPLSLFVIGVRETVFSLILTTFSSLGVYVIMRLAESGPLKAKIHPVNRMD